MVQLRASGGRSCPLQNIYGLLNRGEPDVTILCPQMRRFALTLVCLFGLATPAAALATRGAPSDGTLVVRNADDGEGVGTDSRPVVVLVVHGSVIGRITDQGRIRIDDLTQGGDNTPEVSGATWHKDVSQIATAWGGTALRFRAVGGWYRVTIWGSKVSLFAIGNGNVTLIGQPGMPVGDGVFSVDDSTFRSLPEGPYFASFGQQPTG